MSIGTSAASGRFDISIDGAQVVKSGDPAALAREARGLRLVAKVGCAPVLVSAGHGRLVTERIDGASRGREEISLDDGRALGRLLRRVHDAHHTATGGLAEWPRRARSLAGYRRLRIDDVARAAGDHPLFRALARSPAPAPPRSAERPFRLLHGDLVVSNVLWDPHPRLIDWEFWRMGDPAEDLAYLAEVNDLTGATFSAVVEGYNLPGVTDRVDAWRALVAFDAALWYRSHGARREADRLIARTRTLTGSLTARA